MAADAAQFGAKRSPLAPVETSLRDKQSCPVELRLRNTEGPLVGLAVELRAMHQVDERSWRSRQQQDHRSDAQGQVSAALDCGARLSLFASGWMWRNPPESLLIEQGMAPIDVLLIPELTVRLFVHGGDGPAPEDPRFHRPGDEQGQSIPYGGLFIEGVSRSQVVGEIRSANLPPRAWRPARSDQVEDISPGLMEAVVVLGDIRHSWVELADSLESEVEGVVCIADGKRAGACRRVQGMWRCPCGPPASVALYGPRWQIAVVRPLLGAELRVEKLPPSEELCLGFPALRPGDHRLVAQPAGVSGGLLLGGLPVTVTPGRDLCLRLPRDEAVELRLEGPAAGTWTLTSQGQGRLDLSTP